MIEFFSRETGILASGAFDSAKRILSSLTWAASLSKMRSMHAFKLR